MQPNPAMLDLLTASLSRFANQWRSWGLLAVVIGALIVAFTLVVIGVSIVFGIAIGIADARSSNEVPAVMVGLLALGLVAATALWTVCWQLVFAGLLRLALRELDHDTPARLADLPRLALTDVVPVLAVTIFTMVVAVAGLCLCVVPGLLAGAVLVWALPLVVDQGMDPVTAMRESARRFGERPWWTIGFTLLGTGMMVVIGQVLPIVGPGVGQVLYALYLARGYRTLSPVQVA